MPDPVGGTPVTAAIKRVNIGAGGDDLSKLVSRYDHRIDANSPFVLTCVTAPWKFCIWVLFLIALFGTVLPASVAALGPRPTLTGYFHTSWTAKDGLPGSVLSLAQTTDGFLWIGGTDGLFRFDGLVVERYTPEHGTLLHDNIQSALFATPDGGLWIGYNEGGISFLKNGQIANFTEREGFP